MTRRIEVCIIDVTGYSSTASPSELAERSQKDIGMTRAFLVRMQIHGPGLRSSAKYV